MPDIEGISVVMPTRNAYPFVKQAVLSILRQTYQHFELIVVDGGSEDGTLEYLQKAAEADRRIRIVRQTRGNIGTARNLGIEHARYEWIAVMDADDIALPRRLESQAHFLTHHPNFVLVASDCEYIDKTGRPLGIAKRHSLRAAPYYDPLRDGMVPHQSVLVSRAALECVGGYREFPQAEDYDLMLRLAESFDLALQGKVLVQIRVLASGLTCRDLALQRQYWKYARDCAKYRRAGAREPTFEDWRERNNEWIRAHMRQWRAEAHFRAAGAALCDRRHLQFLGNVVAAAVCAPGWFARKAFSYSLGGS